MRPPNYCGLLAPDILVSPTFSACNWELGSLKNESFLIKSCPWGETKGGNTYHVSHVCAARTLRPCALETQLISREQVEGGTLWQLGVRSSGVEGEPGKGLCLWGPPAATLLVSHCCKQNESPGINANRKE